MKVEILRSRLYRTESLAVGVVTDMDDQTAVWFIARGWAREYAEPARLSAEASAAEIGETGVKRRKAIR